MINGHINLSVTQMLSGPLGGDLQIGGLVASKEVDLVIFLRDPLAKQPHDPDVVLILENIFIVYSGKLQLVVLFLVVRLVGKGVRKGV